MSDPLAIVSAKKQMRQRVRAAVRALSDEHRARASIQACDRVVQLQAFSDARTVMLYLPLTGETDCTLLLEKCLREGRGVCVPRVDWSACRMEPVTITSLADSAFATDERGIRFPRDCRPVSIDSIDVVIVPGLAFDEQCRRLGRAGGFYDRFLAQLLSSTPTIGLAFETQIVEDLPIASHDIAVHMVATERRLILPHPIS